MSTGLEKSDVEEQRLFFIGSTSDERESREFEEKSFFQNSVL